MCDDSEVFDDEKVVVVSIDADPKVLEGLDKIKHSSKDMNKLYDWIKLNLNDLLKQWNREIEISEFLKRMKKVN